MSTLNYSPKQKKDWITNISFYLINAGLLIGFIMAVIYVIMSYLD